MKVIRQSVVLPAPVKTLYAMYLSPRQHAAITGHRVRIGSRPGAKFRAFNGALSGRILQAVPGRLIVQAWRSTAFRKGDGDSTLILRFTPKGRRGRIELTHVNVPAHDYGG
ncbi:MAG TPA: SRPBCC domain-containing protein, partial [Burkholderiales bacterium]